MRRKAWPDGTAIATRDVLAGAYRGRDVSTRVLLSHAVYVDSNGTELATVCRAVKLDNLADCYASDGRQVWKPTCEACLARLMPSHLDAPSNASRRGGGK
jgi:hypothetical protein